MIKKIALILTLSMFFATAAFAKKEGNVNIYDEPRPAPQVPFYTSEGQSVVLDNFKGNFVLLLLWSRECGPCVSELEDLNEFYKQTKDNGITLIMLSHASEWKDSAEQRKFLNRYDAPDLPFYTDKSGKLAEAFGIFTSPNAVMLNKKGQEIGRIRGSAEWDDPKVVEYIYKIKAEHSK